MWPTKYPRTPHWPWSPTIHPDDRTHSDPARFVGREVVVTEKLDGGLVCLHRGEVFARSMARRAEAPWFAMVRKHHAWKCAPDHDHAIYGEDLYGVHSIEYAPIPEDSTFRVFAVRSRATGPDRFLSWDEVVETADTHGMPVVPVCFRGSFPSVEAIGAFFDSEIGKPSSIGGSDREGFVMRDAAGFPMDDFGASVAKYVRPHHVQSDRHWTRNWRPCRLRGRRSRSATCPEC